MFTLFLKWLSLLRNKLLVIALVFPLVNLVINLCYVIPHAYSSKITSNNGLGMKVTKEKGEFPSKLKEKLNWRKVIKGRWNLYVLKCTTFGSSFRIIFFENQTFLTSNYSRLSTMTIETFTSRFLCSALSKVDEFTRLGISNDDH